MRLATIHTPAGPRAAVLEGTHLIDLHATDPEPLLQREAPPADPELLALLERSGLEVVDEHDHVAGELRGLEVVRVVGEPSLKVTKIGFSPGAAGFQRESHALERDDVQVLLVGETREWETIEYAADAVTEGRQKALIVIGHIPSEQPGMEECARWLEGFVKAVPIQFVAAKQPFWTVTSK